MRRLTLPAAIRPRLETPDPPGVTGTYGDHVIGWAQRKLGIAFGRWQAYAIRKALRHDKHGDLIHSTVLLSTGRQNGKSVICRGFVGWILDEGHRLPAFSSWTTLLAAAHDQRQARILYTAVWRDLLGIPELKARNQGRYPDVRLTQYQGVEVEGVTLDTVSNQPGSSRGFSVGLLAWDELLTQTDWELFEAIGATQSAQRNPIRFLTSTAGMLDSVVLRSFYDKLEREATGAAKPDPRFYGAWWQSQDPDAGLSWREIRRANPALDDGRLSRAFIEGEYGTIPPDGWRRERMNHWTELRVPLAVNPAAWAALRTPRPIQDLPGPFVLGIDIEPGWDRATIVAAAVRPDGRVGAAVWRDLEGPLTAELIIAQIDAFPYPVAVVAYDQVSPAAAELERHGAEAWGPEWIAMRPAEVVAACMDVSELIISRRLAVDDPLLDAEIGSLARRPVGREGGFRFTRSGSTGPVDAIFALTFAAHKALTLEGPPAVH